MKHSYPTSIPKPGEFWRLQQKQPILETLDKRGTVKHYGREAKTLEIGSIVLILKVHTRGWYVPGIKVLHRDRVGWLAWWYFKRQGASKIS